MKHHPGIRFASSHKTRASSPGFRADARWRNVEVIPGWTNTGMGRVRLPHIYRFYLSLTALPCRSRRPHTYPRVVRDEKRRRREKKDRGKKRDKIRYTTMTPAMGQLRAVAGRASTRRFVSRHLSRILRRCSRICLITLIL